MKIVIIDNYDSFTYNLSHLVKELGADVTVFRNDKFLLNEIEQYDKIILSPGPGIPSEAGLLLDVIRTYRGRKPMLGVCLGHQAIGEVFGARLTNLSTVYHGVATEGTQYGNDPIFRGMPKRIIMGRYHSWVVDSTSLPECLEVTAMSDDGYIMALRHRHYDIHGIQFHPESVLTPEGRQIVKNWLEL
ncbi:MAG: aminodeoxychorismate/anthranilate synthase component II [bacterium]|nr:aminodeoxychorismate/anthranilate synthase component II [Hoylesella loescheii]MCI6476570.1 aminodeoxychorismate/anthranilate synthase component II [Bacteroidales bacterium]MDO4208683.1 aminodeoxychorismate/anthranilate synthase component II [bacterium]MDY3356556.1 aminodeoxychorismate/anthranilate synthase component II [Prevotella sp.]MCI7037820.1 aminodeoxychorismate/anthranilate synthase component II [Bacteroidales bacterium]